MNPKEGLRLLHNELENISSYPWDSIRAWIAKAQPLIRKQFLADFDEFREITADPKWMKCAHVTIPGQSRDYDAESRERSENSNIAYQAKKRILAYLDGLIQVTDDVSEYKPEGDLERVRTILHKFPGVVHRLSSRGRGKSPLQIKDEYDVQYLLAALLEVDFEDVRPEDWIPNYAGGATRCDFFLPDSGIIIETKCTRSGLFDKDVGDQLIIDIAHYKTRQGCKKLVCFIYDPEHRLRNPRALEKDLPKAHNDFPVDVLVKS